MDKVILLVGSDEDKTLKYFAKFLLIQKREFIFFNQKMLLEGNEIHSDHFIIQGHKLPYKAISGILNRMAAPYKCTEQYLRASLLLKNVLNNQFDNVFNKQLYNISNDSKLFQLSLINPEHIKIPEAVVIAKNPIKLDTEKHHIVKSLSSVRSIAMIFEKNKNIFYRETSDEPVLFQEFIHGTNIRVHVIDELCIALSITADNVDYRYDNTDPIFEFTELPEMVKLDCIMIAKKLRLRFCGIDLIKKEKNFFILEINPSPGWSYFEEKLSNNYEVSNKLMEVLSSG